MKFLKFQLAILVVSVLFLGLVSVVDAKHNSEHTTCTDLDFNGKNSIFESNSNRSAQIFVPNGLDCNNDNKTDDNWRDYCNPQGKLVEMVVGGRKQYTVQVGEYPARSDPIDCSRYTNEAGKPAVCLSGACQYISDEYVVINGLERKVLCKDPDNTTFWLDKNDTYRINNGDLGKETTAYLYYVDNFGEHKIPGEHGYPREGTDTCEEGNPLLFFKDGVNEWYCDSTKKGLEQLQQEYNICPNGCEIEYKSLVLENEPIEKKGACAKVQTGTVTTPREGGDDGEGPVEAEPETGICSEDDETDSPWFKAYDNPPVWLKGKNAWDPGTTLGKDKKTGNYVSRNDFCLKYRDPQDNIWRYELYENYCELDREGEKTGFVKTDPIECSPRNVCGTCTPDQWENYEDVEDWFVSIYGNTFSWKDNQKDVQICRQGRSYCAPQGTNGEIITAPKTGSEGNCQDSDGENKYQAGWAEDVNGRQIDSCLDENNVQEKVCLGTFVTTKTIECENGCFSFKVIGGDLGKGGNVGKYAGRCLTPDESSKNRVVTAPESGVTVPNGQCIDADEGLDEPRNGRWAKSGNTIEFDECKPSRGRDNIILLEKNCEDGKITTEEVNCAQEYSGICLKSEQDEGAKCVPLSMSLDSVANMVSEGKQASFCLDKDGRDIFTGTYAYDHAGALPDKCVVGEDGKTGEILEAVCGEKGDFVNGAYRKAVYEKHSCPESCVDEDGLAHCTGENPGYSLDGVGGRVYWDRKIHSFVNITCRDYDQGASLLQSSCAKKTVFVNGELDPTKTVEKFDVCLPGLQRRFAKDIPAIAKSAVCEPNGDIKSLYVLCEGEENYLCSPDGRSCKTGGKVVERGDLDDIGKVFGGFTRLINKALFTRLINKALLKSRIEQLDLLEINTENQNRGNCPADGEGEPVTQPKAGVDYPKTFRVFEAPPSVGSCTDSDADEGDINEQKFTPGNVVDSNYEYVDSCDKDLDDTEETSWRKNKVLWEAVCTPEGTGKWEKTICNDRCIGPDDFGGKDYAYCGKTLGEFVKGIPVVGKVIAVGEKMISLPGDVIRWGWGKITGSKNK